MTNPKPELTLKALPPLPRKYPSWAPSFFKALKWASPWFLLIAVVLVALLALGTPQKPTSPSDYAAWLQAIFSVVAIVAAVLIAFQQHLRERRRELQREIETELDLASRLTDLLNSIVFWIEELPTQKDDVTTAQKKLLAFNAQNLERAIAMLERFGPADMPSGLSLAALLKVIGNLYTIRGVAGLGLQTVQAGEGVWTPYAVELDRARLQVETLHKLAQINFWGHKARHELT